MVRAVALARRGYEVFIRSTRPVCGVVASKFVREDRRWALTGLAFSLLVGVSSLAACIYSWRYPYQNAEYTTFFCYGYLAINHGAMSWGYDGSPLTDFAIDFPTLFCASLVWLVAFVALAARDAPRRRRNVARALRVTGVCWGVVMGGWLLLPMHEIAVRNFPWSGFTTYFGHGEIVRYDTRCSHCRPDAAVAVSTRSNPRWTPRVWHVEAGQGGFGVYYMEQPMWIPALLFAAPVWLLAHALRRLPDRYCRKCAYDLTGNRSGTCPECGLMIPVRQRSGLENSDSQREFFPSGA
ncbi:MAG TPA: hypothetical protein P5081_18915 [Phycisphaerae bacterium]|nr:hypothetical protein [Phycisphaerae bacterium]HRW54945.1 hypothetical protein [Phycisphaerae bacterium]